MQNDWNEMQTEDAFFDKYRNIWDGGYYEGNPLDPMSASSYGIYGYNSILYTVYLTCIRPFIHSDTTVLEIGPGRGAWTKTFLERGCKKVYAVDAAPPEHTGFWKNVGKTDKVDYIVVSDCTLSAVPDNSIDYFFSFGVFCHLDPEMCETYIASLASKMRVGAEGFLMIADFDKCNQCIDEVDRLSLKRVLGGPVRKVWQPTRLAFLATWSFFRSRMDLKRVSRDGTDPELAEPTTPLLWFHWGVDRACATIERAGFEIVERDMENVPRDPVIHFRKRS